MRLWASIIAKVFDLLVFGLLTFDLLVFGLLTFDLFAYYYTTYTEYVNICIGQHACIG